ncbi:uncharacterized protein LOC132951284 [Metopolophium dirhodum]|uniref:uncharacterized protein LOC132951284 n=1 Tax=Metopolophium dirhodum TaxID=44670 RepID=UPI00298FD5CD|nr:uncharacterized protein LOC132951284 [Metopolophium dirhodum]
MKLIRIFALSAVVFYLTQENETDALIARMIEGGANLAIDIGLKLIKIPIMVGGKIAWKCIKVPTKFVWSLAKIPFKVIIRLAWKLSKKPLKAITPQYLQDTIRQLVTKYRKLRKKKSRIHRFKTAVNNKIKSWENRQKMRKLRYKNNLQRK